MPPHARPQKWHYWETALIGDVVTSIFVHLVINVCLLRVGSVVFCSEKRALCQTSDTIERLTLGIQSPKLPALQTIPRSQRQRAQSFSLAFSALPSASLDCVVVEFVAVSIVEQICNI